MKQLRLWLGLPSGTVREWVVGGLYTLFFLALVFIGGGH